MLSASPYWGFAQVRFADLLANRFRFLVGIGAYFIYVSVYQAIYRAIYAGQGTVGGLSLADALSYVVVAWVLRSMYTNNLDREVTEEVRRGDIALGLLKPADYPLSKLTGAAGETLFRAAFFTLPAALLIGLAYPVRPPDGLPNALAALASAALSFAVYSQVNLLVGLTTVFTEHTVGVQRAKNAAMDLLGGVLLPLSLYPDWARAVLQWLPFQAVAYSPTAIYLGKLDPAPGLAVQALWAVALWLLTRWVWTRALDKLTVQGG
ncbi:MAG TPA: ABC-2 family transporter protein [Deinococcales bacterium]|nr:ABC-2 family transporter protein [Deinococcales bacterium]